jgi:hypothetical protein
MTGREELDGVLSAIDGALADAEFPDAMRWSPEPETVDAPAPFDGELVWQPPQRYERIESDLARRLDEGVRRSVVDTWTAVSASDPLGDLLRARSAVLRRAERRGPTADLLIFDEVFLVDPVHRAEVRARQQQEAQRIVRSIGEWMADAAEAFAAMGEAIGKALASLVPPAAPPPRSLRETDPRAYALQLRRTRGTGPDRQVQQQHRPRRHR